MAENNEKNENAENVAETCIFCRIARGEIPARKLFETEHLVAFHDLAPQAPVHVLIIPRRHLASLAEAGPEDADLLAALQLAAVRAARETGVLESGFRWVANSGADGGQSVFHLHFHLLGGRSLHWPPG
jgi:histidine triad (HIT) family protein